MHNEKGKVAWYNQANVIAVKQNCTKRAKEASKYVQ